MDFFRIGTGLLSLFYFIRIFIQAPYFLFSDGLINHQLVQKVFWYTWQPLFFSAMPDWMIQVILILGLIFSIFLIIGEFSRWSAFLLYLIVVCLYRYQFLVLFVDDVVMHLILFWTFILPTGKTLRLIPWLKNKSVYEEWFKLRTTSLIPFLVLLNVGLIYFIAGSTKFLSPLWINGVALFAVLKLPLGRFADYPFETYENWITYGNYLALFMEPLFVLIVFLKKWSKLKFILGISLIIFHSFILITLDIPFANLGCMIFLSLIFRDEIFEFLMKKSKIKNHKEDIVLIPNKKMRLPATLMIIFLIGAMTSSLTQTQWRTAKRISGKNFSSEVKISSADTGGPIQTFFYGGLWLMGLAQGYRLLDWIDERNFYQKLIIFEDDGAQKKSYDRNRIVPKGMRGSLILTYISDVTWMYVDPLYVQDLKKDIEKRIANRYCLTKDKHQTITIVQSLTKIESFRPKYNKPEKLLDFTCENFKPSI